MPLISKPHSNWFEAPGMNEPPTDGVARSTSIYIYIMYMTLRASLLETWLFSVKGESGPWTYVTCRLPASVLVDLASETSPETDRTNKQTNKLTLTAWVHISKSLFAGYPQACPEKHQKMLVTKERLRWLKPRVLRKCPYFDTVAWEAAATANKRDRNWKGERSKWNPLLKQAIS